MNRIRISAVCLSHSGGMALLIISLLCVFVSFSHAVDSSDTDFRTVSSWRGLVKTYLEFREHAFPLVLPISDWQDLNGKEIMADSEMISDIDPEWFVNLDAGTFFAADKSRLSKEIRQQTAVVIYEIFNEGELLVLTRDAKGTFIERVAFKAPPFSFFSYDLYDTSFIINELSKRRMVWWVRIDLPEHRLLATAPVEEGEIMMMRSSAADTNIIIQAVSRLTNTVTLEIAYPTNPLVAATNGLEVYTCTDLNAFWWEIAATNLSTFGTNMITWSDGIVSNTPLIFYAIGNADADTDLDGICNARERLVMHTLEDDADTDNDGNDDYHDPQPLNDQVSRVYLSIAMPVDGSVLGGVQ